MDNRPKAPAFQWYPGDFKRDTAVQACGFFSRSVWREMLDLMHDGEPYGHLTAGGIAITAAQLARMIGAPLNKVTAAITELGERNVFSRTAAGVIFSRRMVRDEALRRRRAEGGVKGGNPLLSKDNHKVNLTPNLSANLQPTPASASASARKKKPSPNGGGWSTQAGELWIQHFGGTANFGEIGKHFKPLIERYGDEEVLAAWQRYLGSAKIEAQFKSPAGFAQKFGEWRGKQKTAAVSVDDIRRCLLLGGTSLSMLVARPDGFAAIRERDPKLWERVGSVLPGLNLTYLCSLSDFDLPKAIASQLEEIK